MGFDDFFENSRKHHGNNREHSNHDDHRYSQQPYKQRHSNHGQSDHLNWLNILKKINGNGRLKLFVIVAGIIVLVIAIILLFILLPLIMKLINYVSQNGLQGIMDGVTSFLDKIWKGSGK